MSANHEWSYYFHYPEDTYHELYVEANKIIEDHDFTESNIDLELDNRSHTLDLTVYDTSGDFFNIYVSVKVSNYMLQNQEITISRSYCNHLEQFVLMTFVLCLTVFILAIILYLVFKYVVLWPIQELCHLIEKNN